jgi:hypothetical protein
MKTSFKLTVPNPLVVVVAGAAGTKAVARHLSTKREERRAIRVAKEAMSPMVRASMLATGRQILADQEAARVTAEAEAAEARRVSEDRCVLWAARQSGANELHDNDEAWVAPS